MTVVVLDHPLAAARLTELRAAATAGPRFRALVADVGLLLAVEATRALPTAPASVRTPVAAATGSRLAVAPLLVPVLRAGLGLLAPFQLLLPEAEVAMVGLRRDEQTLAADWYLDRLPADLAGRPVFVLDPMLATGGTVLAVLRVLAVRGAQRATVVSLLASPEGLAALAAGAPGLPVDVVTAAVDERLDARGWIVPGLGDAGDRLAEGAAPD